MLEVVFWVVVGVVIGWNVDQPEWARSAQTKVSDWVKNTAIPWVKTDLVNWFKKM